MGYAVGNICYETREQAEDAYYSVVVPYVNGQKLYQPERYKEGWFFQGQKLQAFLPTCDPAKNFQEGAEFGFILMLPLVAAWAITVVRRVLR